MPQPRLHGVAATPGGIDPALRVLRPTRLEIAAGLVFGEDPEAPALPAVERSLTPRRALETAILAALERPPCLVSFSGGRDSSAILAVAAHVARREGLDLPIPATYRYPNDPEAEESGWQELVIRHLGLREWHRRTVTDEFDLLGPLARATLLRRGLQWPPGTHMFVPLLETARGGTVLSGFDGDGLFDWRWARAAGVLWGRQRPAARDVLRVGLALAPSRLRSLRERRHTSLELTWLRPEALARVRTAAAGDTAGEPARWDRRIAFWTRRRYLSLFRTSLALHALDAGARISHPLAEPTFLAALAQSGRAWFVDRTTAMRMLFFDLLPEAILSRPDKAGFSRTLWGPESRSFVELWTGEGIPDDLVDSAALPRAWRGAWQPAATEAPSDMLLHAAWLASNLGGDFETAREYRGASVAEKA